MVYRWKREDCHYLWHARKPPGVRKKVDAAIAAASPVAIDTAARAVIRNRFEALPTLLLLP